MYKLKLHSEKITAHKSKVSVTLAFFTQDEKEKSFIERIQSSYKTTIPLEPLKNIKAKNGD